MQFPGGHKTYRGYLRSRLWKKIRARVMERDGLECQVCMRQARCVHHIDYKKRTLDGNNDASLISLCHDCHHEVEFIGDQRIDANNPHLKAQRLNDMLLRRRRISLADWRGRPRRKHRKKKQRQPKVNRAAMAQALREEHAKIGAAASDSLRKWRSMAPWQRRNLLAS